MSRNIKELNEAIETMEKELSKLKGKVEKAKQEIPKPTIGEEYYIVTENGDVTQSIYEGDSIDLARISIDNYSTTKQKAIKRSEMIKVKKKLKDLANRENKGVAIDWENFQQYKYCITLENENKKVCNSYTRHYQGIGNIYCLAQNFRQIAIKEIGEDLIIELIKSGV